MAISVAIVEDNPEIRRNLVRFVDESPGFRCSVSCGSAEEALRAIPAASPDVVLMDIQLPGKSGIACTAELKALLPGLRVMMLTVYEDNDAIFNALQAGASGYLLKGSGADEVQTAIRAAAAGGMVFGASLAARVASYFSASAGPAPAEPDPFPELTDRERDVLGLLAAGRSNDAIAAELYVSSKTVRNAVSGIYAKLHAAGRAEAIIKAREAGYGRDQPGR